MPKAWEACAAALLRQGLLALGAVVCALAFVETTAAAEVQRFTISKEADTFHIRFEALLDAPATQVYERLTDHRPSNKLSPGVVFLKSEAAPGGKGERVSSALHSCFLLFCRQVLQVEDVTTPDKHTIISHMVAGQGDFAAGDSVWRIEALGEKTRLHYEASRTLAFWIPPLLGTWIIEHTLRRQLEAGAASLERRVDPVSRP